jgi:hypothetical protein
LLNENQSSAYLVPEGSSPNAGKPTAYNGTAFTQHTQVSTVAGLRQNVQALEAGQLTTQCVSNCMCSRCACN